MYKNSAILGVYNKFNFEPTRANGAYFYDKDGRKVLDFCGGVAVNVLGYNNHIIETAIIDQIHKGFFSQSNYFYNGDQEKLAEKLCKLAGFYEVNNGQIKITGKAFFV